MSSNITIYDFLGSFQHRYVNSILIDSLVGQNVVALNATYEELKRRDNVKVLPHLIYEAFRQGFELKHDSAIAAALKVILNDARKIHPECIILWLYVDESACKYPEIRLKEYEKMVEEKLDFAYDAFCSSLSPFELANLNPGTFNILVEHHIDETEIITECTGGPEQEKSIRWYKACERLINGPLRMQVHAIAKSSELSNLLKPKYYYLFKIEEIRAEKKAEENHEEEQ